MRNRIVKLRPATTQYRCRRCGYGISLSRALPLCPMCQRRNWQPIPIARASRHSVQL
jgi:rubrerythrin